MGIAQISVTKLTDAKLWVILCAKVSGNPFMRLWKFWRDPQKPPESVGEVLHPELSLSGFIQPPNPPIGAVVTVVLPLLIYFLVVITCNERTLSQAFEDFVIFATICLLVGLMAFCYLHYMWVKPSRQLLLRLQQYSREGVKVCRLGGYLP